MDGKNRVIDERRALVAKQAARLEQQAAPIAALELELAKATKNSSTSSKLMGIPGQRFYFTQPI